MKVHRFVALRSVPQSELVVPLDPERSAPTKRELAEAVVLIQDRMSLRDVREDAAKTIEAALAAYLKRTGVTAFALATAELEEDDHGRGDHATLLEQLVDAAHALTVYRRGEPDDLVRVRGLSSPAAMSPEDKASYKAKALAESLDALERTHMLGERMVQTAAEWSKTIKEALAKGRTTRQALLGIGPVLRRSKMHHRVQARETKVDRSKQLHGFVETVVFGVGTKAVMRTHKHRARYVQAHVQGSRQAWVAAELVLRLGGVWNVVDAGAYSALLRYIYGLIDIEALIELNLSLLEAKPKVMGVGIGDLYEVDEIWVKDKAVETSYIENVAGDEERIRHHEFEEEYFESEEFEDLVDQKTTRDLATTDRHETQSSISRQTQMEIAATTDVQVSGKYGNINFAAHVGASFGYSKSEARSASRTQAKETVSRAVDEVRRFVKTRRLATTRQKTFERNTHTRTSDNDESTIYRFVDRVYRYQIVKYGARMFVELLVPEPGRALFDAQEQHDGELASFSLKPEEIVALTDVGYAIDVYESPESVHDLYDQHYLTLAAKYEADDLPLPPRPIDYNFSVHATPKETKPAFAEATILVPEAYQMHSVKAQGMVSGSVLKYFAAINGEMLSGLSQGEDLDFSALDDVALNETTVVADDGIKVSIGVWPDGTSSAGMVLHGRVRVVPTLDAVKQWRLQVWGLLKDGYERQVARYEEQVTERMKEEAAKQHPRLLRMRENAELRRAAYHLLTHESPAQSWVTSIESVDAGMATPDLSVTQAEEMKPLFLSEAFEWRDMAVFLLPFMHSESSTWKKRLSLSIVDPKHREFIRAGAARLLVPVTPGFEGKVLRFLQTPIAQQDSFFNALVNDPAESSLIDGPEFGGEMLEQVDLLREILMERQDKYRLGAGTVKIEAGLLTIHPDPNYDELSWKLDVKTFTDVGRQILIAGQTFTVTEVTDAQTGRVMPNDMDAEGHYYLGPVLVGEPWEESLPTSLVILHSKAQELDTVVGSESALVVAQPSDAGQQPTAVDGAPEPPGSSAGVA